MSDAWDKMEKAKEGSYFEKKNQEALARLKQKQDDTKPRLSPVSGEPMEQEVLMGVVIDRCKSSGGIWLDAGELEALIEASKNQEESGLISDFFKNLSGK